jgi:hypothetical protein
MQKLIYDTTSDLSRLDRFKHNQALKTIRRVSELIREQIMGKKNLTDLDSPRNYKVDGGRNIQKPKLLTRNLVQQT